MLNIRKILICTFLLLTGCASHSNWNSYPIDDKLDWIETPFCRLSEDLVKEYITKLESTPYIKADQDWNVLCESVPNLHGTFNAYVTRALVVNRLTGDYSVYSHNDSIWVRHVSLAGKAMKETKSAVVVFTSSPPSTIYTSAIAVE